MNTSKLESLPAEVLLLIISSLDSTADLYAMLCASPTVYQVFREAKRAVLLSVVIQALGPVLRDCIAATLILPAWDVAKQQYTEDTWADRCELGTQEYAVLLHVGWKELIAAKRLTTDCAIALIRANRNVQFFVDVIADRRLRELRKINPDAALPLSLTERRRFAQALFRHQFIGQIMLPHFTEWDSRTSVPDIFISLFKPWELHQISDVSSFYSVLHNLCTVNVFGYGDPSFLKPKIIRLRAQRAAGTKLNNWAHWVVSENRFSSNIPFLLGGPSPALGGCPAWWHHARRPKIDGLYKQEDKLPRLLSFASNMNGSSDYEHQDAVAAPPFAWVDAHAGIDCQRWGRHLRRELYYRVTPRQRVWMQSSLQHWRWLGFCFWDRERVELLQTKLPAFSTGWLTIPPPDDEDCFEGDMEDSALHGLAALHGLETSRKAVLPF